MKRIITCALSCALIISSAIGSFADVDSNTNWKSSLSEPGINFKSKGGFVATYEDFFDIREDTITFVPGKTYYFPCTWGDKSITDDFFENYSVAIEVTTAFPELTKSVDKKAESAYLSSTEAQKRVKSAEFIKKDGKYYFKFSTNDSFSYVDDKTIRIVVIAKDKLDSDYRDWEEMDLDIGYSKNGVGSAPVEYVTSTSYQVDSSLPIVEFDGDLTECTLEFEEGSTYEAKLPNKKSTKMNLLHTTDKDATITDANPKANINFLTFTAAPQFMEKSRLRFRADGKKYVYEVKADGKLVDLKLTNSDGKFNIITSQLTSYAASDIPLKGASIVAVDPTKPSVGTSTEVIPTPERPYNPGTGAAL